MIYKFCHKDTKAQRHEVVRLNFCTMIASLFFILFFQIIGCVPYDIPVVPEKDIRSDDKDLKLLISGYELFQKGEFQKSFKIFEELNQQAENETIRMNALYGMVFTRLVISENSDQIREVIYLLNTWHRLAPLMLKGEGPEMLKMSLLKSKENEKEYQRLLDLKEKEVRSKEKDIRSKEKDIHAKEKDIHAKEKDIHAKEKDIRYLKYILEKKRKEIKTLKNQIESLEKIHQQIQKKKKEIYFP